MEGFAPRNCSQIVNYTSAHDNLTLWDKLVVTMHGKTEMFTFRFEDVVKANKLAAMMYFTFQGHIFLQAGEEFGRSFPAYMISRRKPQSVLPTARFTVRGWYPSGWMSNC